MLTKKWAIAGAVAALLALTGCAGGSSPAPSNTAGGEGAPSGDPIVLSMLGPLSGAFADTGAQIGFGASRGQDRAILAFKPPNDRAADHPAMAGDIDTLARDLRHLRLPS